MISSGYDLDSMLDRYSRKQIIAIAKMLWQDRMTALRAVAFALGGKAASDRVPAATDGEKAPEREEATRNAALARLEALQGRVGRYVKQNAPSGGLEAAVKAQDAQRGIQRTGGTLDAQRALREKVARAQALKNAAAKPRGQ